MSNEGAGSIVPKFVVKRLEDIAQQYGLGTRLAIEYEPGSKAGDGFIGAIVRARISGSQRCLNLICKFPFEDARQREQFNSMILFEREVFIYGTVLPAYEKLQLANGLTRGDDVGFWCYPKCYYAQFDRDNGESVLIFEDLGERNFLLRDKFEAVDYNHVRCLMVALGKFNACSFALKQQNPDVFKCVQSLNDLLSVCLDTEQTKPLTPRNCKLATWTLVNSAPEDILRDKIMDLSNDLWPRTRLHISSDKAEPYAALNHGDCWTNNVMFQYDESGNIADICLLDWQMARYSSPVLDFLLFIYLCGERELRREKFSALLLTFYDSFSKTLTALGGNPTTVLPYEEMKLQIKKFGKIVLSMGTFAVPNLANLTPEQCEQPEKYRDIESVQRYRKLMRELIFDSEQFDDIE